MKKLNQYLKEAEALWMLGLLRVENLPEWASSILSSGIETEEVLQLAISLPNGDQDLGSLFENILKTNGRGDMSQVDALRLYAKQISKSILSEKISPINGANLIWDATLKAKQQGFHELDPFIYAASEMADRPADKELFENAIRAEAKIWGKLAW